MNDEFADGRLVCLTLPLLKGLVTDFLLETLSQHMALRGSACPSGVTGRWGAGIG